MIPTSKPWYQSKSINAGIVTQIGLVTAWFALDVPAELVAETVGAIMLSISNLVQMWARIVAKDRIG